jgi:hypothetical protein
MVLPVADAGRVLKLRTLKPGSRSTPPLTADARRRRTPAKPLGSDLDRVAGTSFTFKKGA